MQCLLKLRSPICDDNNRCTSLSLHSVSNCFTLNASWLPGVGAPLQAAGILLGFFLLAPQMDSTFIRLHHWPCLIKVVWRCYRVMLLYQRAHKTAEKIISFWPSLKSLTELLVISSSWHGLLLLKLLIWTDGSCSRCWLRWTATLRMFCAVILQMGKTEMKKIICLSELRYILSFWVYEQTQSVDALSLSLPSALKCLQSLTDYQLSEQSWTAARRAVLKLLEFRKDSQLYPTHSLKWAHTCMMADITLVIKLLI